MQSFVTSALMHTSYNTFNTMSSLAITYNDPDESTERVVSKHGQEEEYTLCCNVHGIACRPPPTATVFSFVLTDECKSDTNVCCIPMTSAVEGSKTFVTAVRNGTLPRRTAKLVDKLREALTTTYGMKEGVVSWGVDDDEAVAAAKDGGEDPQHEAWMQRYEVARRVLSEGDALGLMPADEQAKYTSVPVPTWRHVWRTFFHALDYLADGDERVAREITAMDPVCAAYRNVFPQLWVLQTTDHRTSELNADKMRLRRMDGDTLLDARLRTLDFLIDDFFETKCRKCHVCFADWAGDILLSHMMDEGYTFA